MNPFSSFKYAVILLNSMKLIFYIQCLQLIVVVTAFTGILQESRNQLHLGFKHRQ